MRLKLKNKNDFIFYVKIKNFKWHQEYMSWLHKKYFEGLKNVQPLNQRLRTLNYLFYFIDKIIYEIYF